MNKSLKGLWCYVRQYLHNVKESSKGATEDKTDMRHVENGK